MLRLLVVLIFVNMLIVLEGLDGAGKSTLMKIIAGVEKGYKGEVVWAPGYTVGYLEQEPRMDPDKTVIDVVREGVQETMDLLNESNEISMKFCEPMSDDEMAALIENCRPQLEQHLAGRIHSFQIAVGVQRRLKTEEGA